MNEFLSYELSDFLLFSKQTYFRQFALINEEFPFLPLLLSVVAAAVAIFARTRGTLLRLALLWAACAWLFLHRHYAGTLHAGAPDGPSVGVEFVATSVTSGGDGSDDAAQIDPILRANPNLGFMCDRRGYLVSDVTPKTWTTHFRVVPFVTRPGAPVETRRTFVVEAGAPRLSPTV